MAEMEIKRVNFFDGQFLKEGEFIDLDAYHLHMRRRWAFVMFDKSGVVQATPNDLTLVAPAPGTLPADKKVLVRGGMALGKRTDLAEAREIVLRLDTEVSLLDPQWGLTAGDTAIFTVHYQENPVANPPSEGDVPGNTRIEEHAVIKVHKNTLSVPPTTGEPYVRLGDVNFDSLAVNTSQRTIAFLNGGLVAPVAAAPQISLTPNSGAAGGPAVAVTVNATGLNLSSVNNASVTISSALGPAVTHNVTNQSTSSFTLTLTIPSGATSGARTITVTVGGQSAAATFTVQPGLQLTGFTPVNEPNGISNFIINGTGFDTTQPAIVQFAGSSVPPLIMTIDMLTSSTIIIAPSMIPDPAVPGVVTVTTGGNTATLSNVTPPAKVMNASPNPVIQGQMWTINGVRLNASTHVFLVRGGVTLMDKSTFAGIGELISANEIRFRIPPGVTSGTCQLRVTTAGGTIVYGTTINIV